MFLKLYRIVSEIPFPDTPEPRPGSLSYCPTQISAYSQELLPSLTGRGGGVAAVYNSNLHACYDRSSEPDADQGYSSRSRLLVLKVDEPEK